MILKIEHLIYLAHHNRAELVAPRAKVEYLASGSQHSGSGDYSASSTCAGEVVEIGERTESTSFVHKLFRTVVMKSPSVVCSSWHDCTGRGGKRYLLCATQPQIQEALEIVNAERNALAATVDLQGLKERSIAEAIRSWEHHSRCHFNGCCNCGSVSQRSSASDTSTYQIAREASEGRFPEGVFSDIELAARRVALMPECERQAFWWDITNKFEKHTAALQREWGRQEKQKRREYADKQFKALLEMGMTSHHARDLMKVAGPTLCVWALKEAMRLDRLSETIGKEHVIDALLRAQGCGTKRMRASALVNSGIGITGFDDMSDIGQAKLIAGLLQVMQ